MKWLLLALLAAVTLGLAATAAADVWDVSPDLRIKKTPSGTTQAGKKVLVYGKILAPKLLCKQNRTVRLFEIRRGPDKLLAKDVTDSDGEYGFALRPRKDKRVYTKIKSLHQTTYPHDHRCRSARSENQKINVN